MILSHINHDLKNFYLKKIYEGVIILKRATSPLTITQLQSMNTKGRLNFNIAIQRKGNIWDINRKSLLVHSLITGFPVPPIYTRINGDIYDFVDGKQRITTLFSFINDEFALSEKTPLVHDDIVAGKKFSELPEEMQKSIKNYTLSVIRLEDITDEEVEEMFFRLNNGVALKSIESTRVLLGNDNMKLVEKMTTHPFFDKASISRNRYTDQEIILQLLMFSDSTDTGFSSKEVRAFVERYRGKKIPEEMVDKTNQALSFLDEAFTKKKKFLKKIHIPMIFNISFKAQGRPETPDFFGLWVEDFYKNLSKESEYFIACQSGSAKKENVQKRLNEMKNAYEQYFTA